MGEIDKIIGRLKNDANTASLVRDSVSYCGKDKSRLAADIYDLIDAYDRLRADKAELPEKGDGV